METETGFQIGACVVYLQVNIVCFILCIMMYFSLFYFTLSVIIKANKMQNIVYPCFAYLKNLYFYHKHFNSQKLVVKNKKL